MFINEQNLWDSYNNDFAIWIIAQGWKINVEMLDYPLNRDFNRMWLGK